MLLSLCFPCMMYEDPVMSPSNIRGTFYKNTLNKIHYFSFKFHISFVDYHISFTSLILLLSHLMFLMQQLQHCGGTNLINIGRVKTSRKGVKLVLYYKFTPNIALLKNVDNFHFVAGPEILNSTQSYILDIIDSRCSSSYIYMPKLSVNICIELNINGVNASCGNIRCLFNPQKNCLYVITFNLFRMLL